MSSDVKIPATGVRDALAGVSLIAWKKANSSGVRMYSMVSPVKIVVAMGLNPWFSQRWETGVVVL